MSTGADSEALLPKRVVLLARFLVVPSPPTGGPPHSTRGDRASTGRRLLTMSPTRYTPWSNPSASRAATFATHHPPQCAEDRSDLVRGYQRVRLRTPMRVNPTLTPRKSPREPGCLGQIAAHDAARTQSSASKGPSGLGNRGAPRLPTSTFFSLPPISIRREVCLSLYHYSPLLPNAVDQNV